MAVSLQSTSPTSISASPYSIRSFQQYIPSQGFTVIPNDSDPSFSKDIIIFSPDKTSSVVRPKPMKPIPVPPPQDPTVVSDLGSVNSGSPFLLPSFQKFMVFPADSDSSLEKRVSKRTHEESETPTFSPIKRPRVEQLIPMTPVPSYQLPTVSTFGYVDSGGPRYSGSYKNGLYHGFGILISANGDTIYTGNFQYGLYHGHGKLIYQNGATYVGEFQKGVFHGQGVLTYPDGTIYEGQFQNGALYGNGVFQSGNFTASGQFQNNLLHGQGTALIKDVLTYIGNFSNGFFHGYGKLSFSNGVTYEGAFHNNFYHGPGQLTFSNGLPPLIGEFRLGIYQQPSYLLQ